VFSFAGCKKKNKTEDLFDTPLSLFEFYSTDLKTQFAKDFPTNPPESLSYLYSKDNVDDLKVNTSDHTLMTNTFESLSAIKVMGEYLKKDIPTENRTYTFKISADTSVAFEFCGNYLKNEDKYYIIENYENLFAITFPGYGNEPRLHINEAIKDKSVADLFSPDIEKSFIYVSYQYNDGDKTGEIVNVEDAAFREKIRDAFYNLIFVGEEENVESTGQRRKYTFTESDGTKVTLVIDGDYLVLDGKYYKVANSDVLTDITFPGYNPGGKEYGGQTVESYTEAEQVSTKSAKELKKEETTALAGDKDKNKDKEQPQSTTQKENKEQTTKENSQPETKSTKKKDTGAGYSIGEGDIDEF
jgi:hypothetical protein